MEKDKIKLQTYYQRRLIRWIGMAMFWAPVLWDFLMSGIQGFERVIIHIPGLILMCLGFVMALYADIIEKKLGKD